MGNANDRPLKVMTVADHLKQWDRTRRSRANKDGKWGPWTLNRQTLCLELHNRAGDWIYEIDLERCATPLACLDWVFHVAQKRTMPPVVVGHMVKALQDLLDVIPNLVRGELVTGGGGGKAAAVKLLQQTGWLGSGEGAK